MLIKRGGNSKGNSATVLQTYLLPPLLLSLWSLLKNCTEQTFPLLIDFLSRTFSPLAPNVQETYGYLRFLLDSHQHLWYKSMTLRFWDIETCKMTRSHRTEGFKPWYVFFFTPKLNGVKLFKHCRLCYCNLSRAQKHKSVCLCQNWWDLWGRWNIRDGTVNIWWYSCEQTEIWAKNTAPLSQHQHIPGWKTVALVWLKFN